MLNYIEGNLLDADCPIVHCVNAQGRMASGVAKAIRAKYPQVYEDYMQDDLLLGNVIVSYEWHDIKVFSVVGQKYYGYDGKRYVSYEALKEGFAKIRGLCLWHNIPKIAMPLIGAGLAGGDWDTIEDIIKTVFTDVDVDIYKLPGA